MMTAIKHDSWHWAFAQGSFTSNSDTEVTRVGYICCVAFNMLLIAAIVAFIVAIVVCSGSAIGWAIASLETQRFMIPDMMASAALIGYSSIVITVVAGATCVACLVGLACACMMIKVLLTRYFSVSTVTIPNIKDTQ